MFNVVHTQFCQVFWPGHKGGLNMDPPRHNENQAAFGKGDISGLIGIGEGQGGSIS